MIIIKPNTKGTKLLGVSGNGSKSVYFPDGTGMLTVGDNDVRYIFDHPTKGILIKIGDDDAKIHVGGKFSLVDHLYNTIKSNEG